MTKGLEALERLNDTLLAEGYWQDVLDNCSIIEKELKALEIIKKIGLNECEYIMCVDYETYKESRYNPIPKEQFDLLKEVVL